MQCRSQAFGAAVNASVFQGNFFDEFQLEGVSADANEIFLEVAPENLSRALKTAQNAKSVKIKLTKKSCPCLTLAAELVRRKPPSVTAKNRTELQKLIPSIILLCLYLLLLVWNKFYIYFFHFSFIVFLPILMLCFLK